ncbi:MAG: hypothetical protein QM677_00805 [Microbacterium sp.]
MTGKKLALKPAHLVGIILGVTTIMMFTSFAGCAPLISFISGSVSQTEDSSDDSAASDAIRALDPRISYVGEVAYYSGFSKTYDLVVTLSGDDQTVSTELLTEILIIVRDSTSYESITLLMREEPEDGDYEHSSTFIDLTDAIAGLPDGLTVLWDGTDLTIFRDNLDKLMLPTSTPTETPDA